MKKTKIIATIGPSSEDIGTLLYFAENQVKIARLNFSHATPQWHQEIGKRAKQAGLELLVDLAGPKVLLGDLEYDLDVSPNNNLILEKQLPNKTYPYWERIDENRVLILPCLFDLTKFLQPKHPILIDDGKIELETEKVEKKRVYCKVVFGGKVKTHKGMNLPKTDLKIDFLVERDKAFLEEVLPVLKPKYIAPSFVKTTQDLFLLKEFIKTIKVPLKDSKEVYQPKICTKIEMSKAVLEDNLISIIKNSDMIMIARGDLALETHPLHIKVPFLQAKIVKNCQQLGKPFIIATQILESMFSSPVPTRAEISDLYRAVVIDQSDYVMLSAESAAGKFPRKCVKLMSDLIEISQKL